jgi:hypothetical protein
MSRLQQKAILVISNSAYNADTDLYSMHTILYVIFEKIILQNKLLFMHSIEYDYAQPAFLNTWTKNNARDMDYNLCNADLYIIPNTRIE